MATMQARWQILTAAPHRMFFAGGMAWLLAWSGWWALLLGARAAGFAGLEPTGPALLLHGAAMLFLAFTPFMYGFLLTVFPRWMSAPQGAQPLLVTAFVSLNAGNLLFLVGLAGIPGLLVIGWVLAAAALAVVLAALTGILWRARTRVSHAYGVIAGLAAGLTGMLLFAPALLRGDYSAWPLVRGFGLWGFLLVVYFTVSHRMIPFFSSRVVPGYSTWRPDWILYAFVLLGLARAMLETAPGLGWLASVPMAAIAITCAVRWRPRVRTGVLLLDVLHVSLAWLAVGLALAALADLATAVGTPGLVGRAPLHALGMGYFGGMLMAMVTRVTLGHAGRPLALDVFGWRLFLAIQAAAVLRLAAEILPAADWLSLTAAVAWLVALLAWVARHLPVYFRPRADGAPG
ncbi:MAG TPA: NnrS family protein [Gammaproteobacteria bacterium]|nr:NnrS family protein [Gammaproteobacteria bacterium]